MSLDGDWCQSVPYSPFLSYLKGENLDCCWKKYLKLWAKEYLRITPFFYKWTINNHACRGTWFFWKSLSLSSHFPRTSRANTMKVLRWLVLSLTHNHLFLMERVHVFHKNLYKRKVLITCRPAFWMQSFCSFFFFTPQGATSRHICVCLRLQLLKRWAC